MASIRYNITSGALPVTVYLKQGVTVIDSNVHTIYETGSFDDVLAGDYTVEMVDANSCSTSRDMNAGGCGYGLLYNWYAATDAKNIAPSGWHVPTWIDIDALFTYIGGDFGTAGKLKEIGTEYWFGPNVDATNELDFYARGAGIRNALTGISAYNLYSFGMWLTDSWSEGYHVFMSLENNITNIGFGTDEKYGVSLRLIKDDANDTGIMTGNDGKVYSTITIGTQVWLAQNLMETRYRDGSLIPEVTDNTEWAALTTGALCAYDNDWNYACLCDAPQEIDFCIEYGALYNWWVATDSRNIAPSGWHVPSNTEANTLKTYLGGYSVAGGHLKESGTSHWYTASEGADNSSGFTLRPTGRRMNTDGTYIDIIYDAYVWTSTEADANSVYNIYVAYNDDYFTSDAKNKKSGMSIRLIKDDANDTGIMTGNDGKVYPTVTIGTQVWMAADLAETKYRNGDLISGPTFTNGEWAALTTEAMCYYEDDFDNVGVFEACPTTTSTTTIIPTTTSTTTAEPETTTTTEIETTTTTT